MSDDPVKILAIDDEVDVTKSIRLTVTIQEPGWQVVEARSGRQGLDLIESEKPDIVLLDMRMPGMTGLDVLGQLRRFSTIPVIMLTVTNDELYEVQALEGGADDYIVKPFGHLELLARIKAVLRRSSGGNKHRKAYANGDLRIDFENRQVVVRSAVVSLTSTEYTLLQLLTDNANQILTSEILLGRIWGPHALDNREYLKVYIRKLREKIERDPAHPEYIETVRGIGYRFAEHGPESAQENE
jgi:DNA-binding response OmpR family regulator